MKPTSRLPLLAAVLAALFAFASIASAQNPTPGKKPDEKNALPYRITHGDVLAVSVFAEPDLNSGNNRVEQRGTITLQLINEIRIAGMTVLEAQAAIENAYRDQRFLRNPQVKVTIEGYAPRLVSVSGKVNNQGRRELPADRQMTIKELILACGGFAETARGNHVLVTRTLPDGSIKTYDLDVQSALLGKQTASVNDANFILEPEDIVYVPEKII
jgi:polysaccharide export outer membrane protein